MTTSTNIASTNWSGAVLTAASRESFSTVSAEWVVPTVSQVPIKGVTTSDVSEWVGLDGYNSADVCQAGILETVQTSVHGGTRISCSAFDEWYPAGSNSIAASSFVICSPKTGPFRIRVFRGIFPWLGGAEDDEGITVLGRPEGVHSPAGR